MINWVSALSLHNCIDKSARAHYISLGLPGELSETVHISPVQLQTTQAGVLGGTARMCLSTKSRQISSPGRRTGRGSSKSPPVVGLTITVE